MTTQATASNETTAATTDPPPSQHHPSKHDVQCRDLSKLFTRHESPALDGIDLTIAAGSISVLLGPSGCGKTTLLRCVSGLETPTAGDIHIGGREVTRVAAEDRGVAMVFQNYALYPNKTVHGNLEFPLRMARIDRAARKQRVTETAQLLRIEHLLDRHPSQLSGGQRQRVGIGRALIRRPGVLLMDEPFSNLDAELRATMRAELIALQQRLGMTIVFVTHDQIEALALADQLVVMNNGRIEQAGPPETVFDTPGTEFVATFLGGMNVLPGSDVPASRHPAARLGFRPDDVHLGAGPDSAVRFHGTVLMTELHGRDRLIHLGIDDHVIRMRVAAGLVPQGRVIVHIDPTALHHFADDGSRLAP